MKNLPLYEALIIDEGCGVNHISLVQNPAVESNFMAFSKEKQQVMFTANEEKQMITGVLMRCDYPIYRNDGQLGEYYIQFGADTIKLMAEKILKDNNQNAINIEHIPNSDIEGVDMIEMYIKNSANGISPKGFEDINDGSLFATYKVNNTAVWDYIKQGQFKGFSIEGSFAFDVVESKEDKEYDEIMSMIDKLEKIKNK